MLFSSQDKNKDQNTEKKRSILGFLFNPRIDRDIAPIRENASMFVYMLATLFMSTKLFPKDHPAMQDPSIRLTIREVIGTAYSNLTLTKEGIPQIIFFCAVVGILGFSALFMLIFVLSLFTSNAHAASLFESPAGEKDWANAVIDYLFLGEKSKFFIDNNLMPNSTDNSIHKALGAGLSLYSTAVLVLAGLLLLYHLTFMVAETAHTGKPMGRANQIWAPIRLVFAIGLLVPIASSSTDAVVGYNTGQYIGMEVGRWGSGLASNVWTVFTDALTKTKIGCSDPDDNTNPSCIRANNSALNSVVGLMSTSMCLKALDQHIGVISNTPCFVDSFNGGSVTGYLNDKYKKAKFDLFYKGKKDFFEFYGFRKKEITPVGVATNFYDNFSNPERICGGYIIPAEPKAPYNSVYKVTETNFITLKKEVDSFTNEHYKKIFKHGGEYQDIPGLENKILSLYSNYKSKLENDLNKALMSADEKAYNNNKANDTGWLTAGAWFNDLARIAAIRSSVVDKAVWQTITPALSAESHKDISKVSWIYKSDIKNAGIDYKGFEDTLNAMSSRIVLDNTKYEDLYNTTSMKGHIKNAFQSGNPIDMLVGMVVAGGTSIGLWNQGTGKFAFTFTGEHNPLFEMAALGQKFMRLSTYSFTMGGAAVLTEAVAGGAELASAGTSKFITKLAGAAAAFFFFLGGLFLMVGFPLAYVLPLFPFIRFFFASIIWFMSLFELIVSIPLWALAHINPYGEGIAGNNAKYGYSMLMQVLLRPVLMIFGLIAGLIIFSAAILFFNYAFDIATSGTGNMTGGLPNISYIIYSVLYCVLAYILANQCFSTIGLFPQAAMKWLGMQGVTEEPLGNVAATIGAAGGYMSKDIAPRIQGVISGAGSTAGAGIAKLHNDRQKNKASAAEGADVSSKHQPTEQKSPAGVISNPAASERQEKNDAAKSERDKSGNEWKDRFD